MYAFFQAQNYWAVTLHVCPWLWRKCVLSCCPNQYFCSYALCITVLYTLSQMTNLSVYQSVGWVSLQKRRNSFLRQFVYIKSSTTEATRLPKNSFKTVTHKFYIIGTFRALISEQSFLWLFLQLSQYKLSMKIVHGVRALQAKVWVVKNYLVPSFNKLTEY